MAAQRKARGKGPPERGIWISICIVFVYVSRYVCGNTVKEVVPPEIRLANLDSL